MPVDGSTIHQAELESGPSGRVLVGAEIEFDTAVARRRAGQNVVVCGTDTNANQRLAGRTQGPSPCLTTSKRGELHRDRPATLSMRLPAERRGGRNEVLHSRADHHGAVG